jgi:hypothetical protein
MDSRVDCSRSSTVFLQDTVQILRLLFSIPIHRLRIKILFTDDFSRHFFFGLRLVVSIFDELTGIEPGCRYELAPLKVDIR